MILASQADARTMVVFRKSGNPNDALSIYSQKSGQRFDTVVRDVLDHVTGGQSDTACGYVGVRDDQVTTEDIRNGQIVYGRGTPNPRVVQFDAVLTVGMGIGSAGAGRPRLDSLFMANKNLVTAGGPRVPLGVLFSDEIQALQSSTSVSCAACSVGVADAVGFLSGVAHVPFLIRKAGSARGWYTAGLYNSCFVHDAAREPVGGYRPLLQMVSTNVDLWPWTGVTSAWRDSAWSYGANDSVVAWELPHGGFAASLGASPVVFAYADGNGGPKDSLMVWNSNNSADPILANTSLAAEVDPSLIMVVLARLDSMTNHRVLSPQKTLRLGVTIDGGFMRTTHLPGPGIAPTDSNFFKATLDSLANLEAAGGVKFYPTVGVNVDSMTTGNNGLRPELGWWRKLSGVRFSPQVWAGVKTPKTTSAGDGIANVDQNVGGLVDVLGFRRARFFKGDDDQILNPSTANNDTSICAMMRSLRGRMLTGGARTAEMSHTLLPPLDDWSPASLAATVGTRTASGRDLDSMLYVCRTCGGFSVIRSSNVAMQSQPWKSGAHSATYRGVPNGTWGYAGQEGYYNDAAGVAVKVLCGGWRSPIGAANSMARLDSVPLIGGGYVDPLFEGSYVTWAGLTRTKEYENGDYHTWYPSDRGGFSYANDNVYATDNYYVTAKNNIDNWHVHDSFPGSAHILTLSMADLSGRAGGTEANGARNGYWLLKSLKNSFDTINDFAGRTVCRFDYPENIEPAK